MPLGVPRGRKLGGALPERGPFVPVGTPVDGKGRGEDELEKLLGGKLLGGKLLGEPLGVVCGKALGVLEVGKALGGVPLDGNPLDAPLDGNPLDGVIPRDGKPLPAFLF